VAAGSSEQRAREFIDAMNRGDEDRVGELLADDVQWWIPRSGAARRGYDVPLDGRAAVAAMRSGASDAFEEVQFSPEFVTGGDDGAAAVVRITGRLAGGDPYGPHQYCFVFRFADDGRIAEVWELTDTAAAFEERGIL
jgi:ketosteroid isomerase-like protein